MGPSMCELESMRSRVALVATLLLLPPLAGQAQSTAGTKCPAQACADVISVAIDRGDLGRVEVLRVRPDIETRAAITPDALERIYDTKLVIRNIAELPLRSKMIEAFKGSSIQPRDYIADLRWGVIFYSRNDVRIGAIYFDRSGRSGAVNDAGASFGGGFFHWLQSTFSACP